MIFYEPSAALKRIGHIMTCFEKHHVIKFKMKKKIIALTLFQKFNNVFITWSRIKREEHCLHLKNDDIFMQH